MVTGSSPGYATVFALFGKHASSVIYRVGIPARAVLACVIGKATSTIQHSTAISDVYAHGGVQKALKIAYDIGLHVGI